MNKNERFFSFVLYFYIFYFFSSLTVLLYVCVCVHVRAYGMRVRCVYGARVCVRACVRGVCVCVRVLGVCVDVCVHVCQVLREQGIQGLLQEEATIKSQVEAFGLILHTRTLCMYVVV